MSRLVTIRFVNSDAVPKVVSGMCEVDFVSEVMEWYGSHFSGDRYFVEIDGRKVQKDRNGCLMEKI